MGKLTERFGIEPETIPDAKPKQSKFQAKKQKKKEKKKKVYTAEDLEIKPLKTNKDKIRQPRLATEDYNMLIPPVGSSVVFSGKSGCGKSTLLARLLIDSKFYKGYFDETFIFSPTANSDDIQKQMGIPKDNVYTDLDDAVELLEAIQKAQKKLLDEAGADEVPQMAVIFDDVIGDKRFMNSKEFTKMFYQVRHLNCTTFMCTQHFKRLPVVCRNQANFIFFFAGSRREVEVVAEEYCPPGWRDKEFIQLIDWATRDDYSFFTINMKISPELRFRKKLYMILPMSQLKPEESEVEQSIGCIVDRSHAGDQTSEQLQAEAKGEHGSPASRGEVDVKGGGDCAESQRWQRHSKQGKRRRDAACKCTKTRNPTGSPTKKHRVTR